MKPPPKFVTNEAAWSYTLHKLAGQGQLDEHGDPKNYGGAIAIYKNVVEKYADSELPVVESEQLYSATREEIVGFQVPRWVIGRNTAFGSTDESTSRMWFDADRYRWCVESHGEARKTLAAIPVESALWLAREQPDVIAWIREQTEEAIERFEGMAAEGRVASYVVMESARDALERGLNVAA